MASPPGEPPVARYPSDKIATFIPAAVACAPGVKLSLYSRILQSTLLPGYDRLRGRYYCRHRAFLEKSQWWRADQLRDFQWQELRRLLAHAFEKVPYYRQKYATAGVSLADIRNWDDFVRLPPLTREEVNRHREELCAKSYAGQLLPQATGGSSGTPTRFFITHESFDWRLAATERAYAWTGCQLGERTLYLWGAPVGHQPGWTRMKDGLFHWLRRELIINTFTQTEEFWARAWEQSIAFQPRFIVGYVSSLESFVRRAAGRGGRLRKLRAVLAAAEPVSEPIRQQVANQLQVPLYNTYGSREFMSIGVECERREGLHVNSENIVLETEHPPAEGPSEFLVTDLHNFGMPFIRYRIGDMGVLDAGSCACGRGLPRIHSIAGRSLDVLRGKDGRVVPGEFFPHLLKDIAEVIEFQVEQKSLERIIVSVVLARALSQESETLLKTELNKTFGSSTHVEIQAVDSIPLRASGKRRVTVGIGG